MQAAGQDSSEAAAKVKEWQGRQQEFLAQTGFKRQYFRIIYGAANSRPIQTVDKARNRQNQKTFSGILILKTD